MRHELKTYFDSFRLSSTFIYIVIIDVLYWVVMANGFLFFGRLIENKFAAVTGGKSVEGMQAIISNLIARSSDLAAVQEAAMLESGVRELFFMLAGGLLLTLIIGVLFYSLSQALIWSIIAEKEFTRKRYWRWNGLHILIGFVFIALVFFFTIGGKLLAVFIQNQNYLQLMYVIALLVGTVGFFVVLFSIQSHFVHHYRVWQSIAAAYHSIKQHKCHFGWLFFSALLTFVIIQLIQIPFQKQFFLHPTLEFYVPLALLFLYMGWLRLYVEQTRGSLSPSQ